MVNGLVCRVWCVCGCKWFGMAGNRRWVRVVDWLLLLHPLPPPDEICAVRDVEHDGSVLVKLLFGDEIDSIPKLSLSLGYFETFFDSRLLTYISTASRCIGFVGISMDGGLFGDRNESIEFWLFSEMRSCCCCWYWWCCEELGLKSSDDIGLLEIRNESAELFNGT